MAIDIDGTASAYPAVISALSAALARDGHAVALLTGHSCPDPDKADMANLLDRRKRQVAPWFLSFNEIVVCVGMNSGEVARKKAAWCRDRAVDLFIDDSRNYCEAVRRLSPGTMALWVYP